MTPKAAAVMPLNAALRGASIPVVLSANWSNVWPRLWRFASRADESPLIAMTALASWNPNMS